MPGTLPRLPLVLALALALAIALIACGGSRDRDATSAMRDLIDRERSAVEQTLTRMSAVGRALGEPAAPTALPQALDPPLSIWTIGAPPKNAAVVMEADLADPGDPFQYRRGVRPSFSEPLEHAFAAVRRDDLDLRRDQAAVERLERALSAAKHLRYLLVVRPHELVAPGQEPGSHATHDVAGEAPPRSAMPMHRFNTPPKPETTTVHTYRGTAGYLRATVELWDLEGPTLRGAFPLEVTGEPRDFQSTHDHRDTRILAAFRGDLDKAFETALRDALGR